MKTRKITRTRSIASEEEQAERAAAMQTQGRKGCKAKRINMAFTPENYKFVKVMASASGRTMTEFTNLVIAAYQREHPEIMEQAKGFINVIDSGTFTARDSKAAITEKERIGGSNITKVMKDTANMLPNMAIGDFVELVELTESIVKKSIVKRSEDGKTL